MALAGLGWFLPWSYHELDHRFVDSLKHVLNIYSPAKCHSYGKGLTFVVADLRNNFVLHCY